ncbi:unnamed protein product [Leptosia nina]|uniref:Secreted protein n=1 Tax=Leptosia nina TaxID=320188 RepID=A0AAV1JK54_9NEOP
MLCTKFTPTRYQNLLALISFALVQIHCIKTVLAAFRKIEDKTRYIARSHTVTRSSFRKRDQTAVHSAQCIMQSRGGRLGKRLGITPEEHRLDSLKSFHFKSSKNAILRISRLNISGTTCNRSDDSISLQFLA